MIHYSIPETWEIVKLGDVATIVGGGTPSRDVKSYFDGDVSWATPTDVTELNDIWINQTAESITEKGLASSSAKLLPVGTVLMTSRATIGATAITRRKMATNQGFANFICNDSVLSNEYLAYWLPAIKEQLIRLAGGTTFKEISKSTLARVEIPLPPLSEQQRIVAILRQADELCRLRRETDENMQLLIPALFYEMFGDPIRNEKEWQKSRISEVCDLVRGSSPRPQGDPRYFGGPIPRLMVADITRDGTHVTPKIDSLTEEGAKLSRLMKAGSVIMAVSGAPGLPAILNVDACIHDGFVGFRNLNKELNSEFFLGFLLAMKAKNTAQAVGATFQNLNTDQIKNWFVLIPSLHLQQVYTSRAEEVRVLEKQQSDVTQKFDALYQSLLAQAFTGELTAKWREKQTEQGSEVEEEILESFHQFVREYTEKHELDLTPRPIALVQRPGTRPDLSEEQIALLYELASVQGYFTAETLKAKSELPLTTIRQGLQLFAEIGLIRVVRLPDRPMQDIVVYILSYRGLHEEDQAKTLDLDTLLKEAAS